MEEQFKMDTENLKNETVEAAKKVKESLKGANIKEETKATKGFIIDMFKNPIEKIKEVANDNSGKFFKTALFLIIIWSIVILVDSTYSTIYYYGFSYIFKKILSTLKVILTPAIGIMVYSLIVLILNKEKKPLTSIIATVAITQLPLIISELVSLLTIISSGLSTITIPFANVCLLTATVLSYFGFKNLFGEEDDKVFIKKYVFIQIIYYVAYIVIRLLGIYI